MSIEELKRLTEDLARKEVDLAEFFSFSPVFLVIADPNYFRRVSQSLVDYLGYTAAELTEQPWRSFLAEKDRPSTEEIVARMEKSPTIGFLNHYRTRSGERRSIRWFSSRWVPVVEGGLTYAIGLPGGWCLECEHKGE